MKPPHRVHPLQERELKELQQVIKTHPDPRVRWRALMIRLSHEGRTAPEIAKLLGGSRQKVLTWIERYEQQGVSGMEDRPRSGAHPKADAHYIVRLKEAIASDPRALGYRFSVWSVERLQKHMKRETGIDLVPGYLAELMKKNRIVYRKPKHDLSHKQDPQEVEEKKQLLEFLKKTQ